MEFILPREAWRNPALRSSGPSHRYDTRAKPCAKAAVVGSLPSQCSSGNGSSSGLSIWIPSLQDRFAGPPEIQ